jgi:RNA polymerase sigma-70 factor (ECF subfamily)
MGRHAAGRPPLPADLQAAGRPPLHADLFAPPPGATARQAGESRALAAFEALVRPHRAGLRDYVHKLTEGDDARTESIVKETLYRAGQDPARYPQRSSAVRPWLVLIARAALRDGELLAPAGHDDRPEHVLPPATTILGAMDALADTHREILVELFYRGVSLEEAAHHRGVPVETVKAWLYHAMLALRGVIDRQVGDTWTFPGDT